MVSNAQRITISLLAVLSLGVPASASASPVTGAAAPTAVDDAPPKLLVKKVTAHGSGCKDVSAVAISPDKEAFTVVYPGYIVRAGRGAKPSEDKAKCRLVVSTIAPAGYVYAIAKIDYRGFAILSAGAGGVVAANYHVQGTKQPPLIEHPIQGPLDDFWQYTDTIATPSWSPCGKERTLNIDTQLEVSAASSSKDDTQQIGMDSTDGEFFTRYRLTWKRCA